MANFDQASDTPSRTKRDIVISWLPAAVVLVLAIFFFIFGFIRASDPFKKLTILLDRSLGPSFWQVEKYFRDREQNLLVLNNLTIKAGGPLQLKSDIFIERLYLTLPQHKDGSYPNVLARDIKTNLNDQGFYGDLRLSKIDLVNMSFKSSSPTGPWSLSTESGLFSDLVYNLKDNYILTLKNLTFPAGFTARKEGLSTPKVDLASISLKSHDGRLKFSSQAISLENPKAKIKNIKAENIDLSLDSFLAQNDVSQEGLKSPSDEANFSPFTLSLGTLEVNDLTLERAWYLTPGNFSSLLSSLSSLSAADFPAAIIFTRSWQSSLVQLKNLIASWPLQLDLKIESGDIRPLLSQSLSIKAHNLSLAPAVELSPHNLKADNYAQNNFWPEIFKAIGPEVIRGDIEATASFDPQTANFTLTAPALTFPALFEASMILEIINLTPEALKSLNNLTYGDPQGALNEPTVHQTGLSRLNLDFKDLGILAQVVTNKSPAPRDNASEGANNSSGANRENGSSVPSGSNDSQNSSLLMAEKANHLADAIEMSLTINYDPWLANAKELSSAIRSFLAGQGHLAFRLEAAPPLSPGRVNSEISLADLLNSLNLTVTVDLNPPTRINFRNPGFDRDFTFDDSGLYPKR
ncbi:MAG: hypothetical protein LBE31_10020 [Deltaproteobacteria bacterium]|jgi:hypothetical protein|nr:hypothetical protein [Deltaproteobacteria bacterium]